MLSTLALVVSLVPCNAQDNHRETHKTLFRSGTRLNKERLRTSTTAAPLVTPQPTVTEAPTTTTTSTTAEPSVVVSAGTNNTEVLVARENPEAINATNTPKAEKLFGQPDLRTHLLAQQQRQQQLAFEVLKAATQTPNGFAQTQIQQASVPDLQQLLAYMQQAQQGNQYSVYAAQPQQFGFGTTGAGIQSFFQQGNQYQPTPAFFSPNLSPYGQQQQQQQFGGLNGISLPYNPPVTPNYVFHNGGYHIQGSSSLPANLQGQNVPTIKFSVATPISASIQEQPQEIQRPPPQVFVRPTQPSPQPPSPPQFINTVFQNPNDQPQIPPPSFRPSPDQTVFPPSQGRPPFGLPQDRPPFGLPQAGQTPFGISQGQPQFPQQGPSQPPFNQQQEQPQYIQQQEQPQFIQQQGQSPSFGGQNQGNFVSYFPQRANNQQQQQPFLRGEFTQQTQQQGVLPSPQPPRNHPFSRTPVFFPPQALKGLKKTEATEVPVEENEVKEVKEAKIEASRVIPIYTSLIRNYSNKF